MKWISFLILLIPGVINAQLEFSTQSIDFENVLTAELDSTILKVTNKTNAVVSINGVNIYDSAFYVTESAFVMDPGKDHELKVYFKPRHNITYNSELILKSLKSEEFNIDLRGMGRLEGNYYSSTFDKSNQALKDELKTIISDGYTNLGYTTARDRMYGNIDNVDGKVTCVYTGRQATFNTRSGANSSSFNCEHTWPQSKFNSNEPERADIHHLFPTDANSNSRRGSFPFGLVSSATWTEGGSKLGGGKFEPRDEQKGATARAMLYFAIRYQDYGNFIDGQESILVDWHLDNPPSDWDRTRNEKIFGYQKNRNPFIDHPEFTERIKVFGANDPFQEIKNLVPNQSSLSFLNVTPNDRRTIHLVNTGNTKIENISNLTSLNNYITILDFDTEVEAGDALAVTIGFSNLESGTYSDELRIDISGENGQIINLAISFDLTATSNKSVKSKDFLSYYNPTTQSISLKNTPDNVKEIEVYTVTGTRVLLDEISSSFTDIPFLGHAPGIYFVVVKTDEDVYSARFMVND